jgi:hypothetical protein
MLPSVPGVCDHKLAVLDTQAHFSAGTKANPRSQDTRNPHTEAIPPFLDPRLHGNQIDIR